MEIDVQLDPKALAFLERESRQFPKQVQRAWYYAMGISLKNMRSRMSGHHKAVPRWMPFTRKFRRALQAPERKVFGGKLMYPNGKQLTMQPEGDRCRIGWIGALEPAAIRFQQGSAEETSPNFRHFVYKLNVVPPVEVPRIATTPPRDIVDAVLVQSRRHMAEWMLGAFARIMEGKLQSWSHNYHKTNHTEAGARAALGAAQEHLARLNHGDFGA